MLILALLSLTFYLFYPYHETGQNNAQRKTANSPD
jgi:hypothetical protein